MKEPETALNKYVYLDVVGFTRGRSVEAQSSIVQALNRIVLSALKGFQIEPKNRILIPTGDGICIALINPSEPYDIHILLALGLLKALAKHNKQTKDSTRKFEIRIGINENHDNLIIDINKNRNVSGQGINLAQRVMSCADGNQILISQSVFEIVGNREKYISKTASYVSRTKHGEALPVYLLKDKKIHYLNSNIPSIFAPKPEKIIELSEFECFYIASAIKFEEFFQKYSLQPKFSYAAFCFLYVYATDALAKQKTPKNERFHPSLRNGKDLNEVFEYYLTQDLHILSEIRSLYRNVQTPQFRTYFDSYKQVFLNENSKKKFLDANLRYYEIVNEEPQKSK